jgi:hypothetical protein
MIKVVALLMMNALPNIVRFPLEWVVVLREYMAGHNALGPYVVSKAIYDLQLLLGPILLATLLYWMTGTTGTRRHREGGREEREGSD